MIPKRTFSTECASALTESTSEIPSPSHLLKPHDVLSLSISLAPTRSLCSNLEVLPIVSDNMAEGWYVLIVSICEKALNLSVSEEWTISKTNHHLHNFELLL